MYLDARLGLLHNLLMVFVLLYIVLFAIIHNKGYIQSEQAFGQVEMHVLGKTHFKQEGKDLVVDSRDLIDPALEHGYEPTPLPTATGDRALLKPLVPSTHAILPAALPCTRSRCPH